MKKQIFGRRFKRDENERKALFNGLLSAMVINGSIKTTEQKAKAIKGDLDKLITKAKKEEREARRLLEGKLKASEITKLINEIAPGFKNRNGGYTRIIKTGRRFNDNASMVVLSWVEGEAIELKTKNVKLKTEETKDAKLPVKKAAKKTVVPADTKALAGKKAKAGKKEKK